ncbi:hypothetical protein BC941DRAFT_498278 [Chlamydoabsidia padenii]|nr:hypothetical protein BC941DRAFT_498278 [Chlamydoabsidia padenii]
MKTIFLLLTLTFLLCLSIEATNVKPPVRFIKRAAAASQKGAAPVAHGKPSPPAVAPTPAEKSETETKIVPDAKGKQDLKTMVESLVSLVNGLRKNGTIQLPDPMEREFKAIIENLEKLQDDLDTDLDIDMGNLLNSGGK